MTLAPQTAPAAPSGAVGAVVGTGVQRTVLGIDTTATRTSALDHHLADLADVLPAGVVVSTHLVRADQLAGDGHPHVSVSIDVPGAVDAALVEIVSSALGQAALGQAALVVELLADDGVRVSDRDAAAGARVAVSETLTGSGGRAVLFPGSGALTGRLTVAELVARSAVDRVVDLTGSEVDPAVVVLTRDFVRPRRVGHRLALTVQPAWGGTVVPFEDPDPTPCCAVHA